MSSLSRRVAARYLKSADSQDMEEHGPDTVREYPRFREQIVDSPESKAPDMNLLLEDLYQMIGYRINGYGENMKISAGDDSYVVEFDDDKGIFSLHQLDESGSTYTDEGLNEPILIKLAPA